MIAENESKIMYLKSSAILKYLVQDNNDLDTLIMTNPNKHSLRAFDNEVYEALASLKESDSFNMNKLKKFFEVIDIYSFKTKTGIDKPVLTEDKLTEIRAKALRR